MTKPDYGKEDLELKAETDRIEEETDRLERSYSDMKAKYDRKVQDCAVLLQNRLMLKNALWSLNRGFSMP